MDEEIKEEKLDSPLVVHKKSDASYQDTANEVDMNATHEADDTNAPTLERHRFKREKKNNKGGKVFFAILLIIAVAVVGALAYSGRIALFKEEPTTEEVVTETTTENKFKNTIVIKDTYIFYEGEEVDGIRGLELKIKYLDLSQTKITIIQEHAQSDFLNNDVLELLARYQVDYEITFMESTGLVAQAELTTAPPPTTTEPSTEESTEANADGEQSTEQADNAENISVEE